MFISFDVKKMDASKLKLAVASIIGGATPGLQGLFAPPAQAALLAVGTRVEKWIDDYLSPVSFKASANPALDAERYEAIEEVVVTVFKGQDGFMASKPMTAAQHVNFLGKFASVPKTNLDYALANPMIIDKLNAKTRSGKPVFSEAQQEKILANIDWMKLLLEWAPMIVKLLLMFI
jgi:hypothetical protein